MDNSLYKKLVDSMVDYCKGSGMKAEDIPSLIEKYKLDVLTSFLQGSTELHVIKKEGLVEKFDEEKLFLSIGNASDEIEEPLTSGDIHTIVSEVIKELKAQNRTIIPSYQIRDIVLNSLNDLAFFDVSKSYKDYTKGR